MPATAPPPQSITLHATTVALAGHAALIIGAAGSGKSGLALKLMALGATLVADDRTCLTRCDGVIEATCPDPIAGLIEARGIGLLHAEHTGPAPLLCVIDLDQPETHRLPPPRFKTLLGLDLPLLHKVETPAWPAGLAQYLKAGRRETP